MFEDKEVEHCGEEEFVKRASARSREAQDSDSALRALSEQLSTPAKSKPFCVALKHDILQALSSGGTPSTSDVDSVNFGVDTILFSAIRAIANGNTCADWLNQNDVYLAMLILGRPEIDMECFYERVRQECKTEIKAYEENFLKNENQ